ncbi:MAG TPA: efflux RND transporter periplasmic adaptor subunit [Polyangia bacterium]|nr:efflux RND transporter periplasmic adaptor subunit [Polyangia bacterium]
MTTTERSTSNGARRAVWLVAGAILLALAAAFILRQRAQRNASAAAPASASASASATAAESDRPSRGGRSGAGGADRVVPVLVTPAARRDVPISVEGLGTVTAYQTVNVRTQVDGRLDRVNFKEGQAVKRGDLLAQVDSRPFTIQLHTAEAALARDQAQLLGAELNLRRYEAVVAQKLIPQQQVDDQRALTEQLKGTIRADQAQIENARLQLAYARITSPIDGVTGIRLVDQGNVVHAGDASAIVVVTQLDPIAVLFTLPQDDLARVVRAQVASKPVVEILTRDGDQPLAAGELVLIDNQINQNTATLRLKAVFANPRHQLWPNQFVKTRLQLEVRKGVLVVPAAAVQRGPQGTFVYTVGADDKAVMRTVQVDTIAGADALLSGGLEAGDRVIIEGQSQLRPGARVSVRQPGGDATAEAGAGGGGAGAGAGGGKRGGGGQRVK